VHVPSASSGALVACAPFLAGCDGVTEHARPLDAGPPADAAPRADAAPAAGCDSGLPGVACLAEVSEASDYANLAVDDANVYWLTSGPDGLQTLLLQVPRDGGAVVTLARGASEVLPPLNGMASLATDGSFVYSAGPGTDAGAAILRVPAGGGAVTTLASASRPLCLAVDATHIYWNELSTGMASVAMDGGALSTYDPPTFLRRAVMGSVVVDTSGIYWLGMGIERVAQADTAASTVVAQSALTFGDGVNCHGLAFVGPRLIAVYAPGDATDGLRSWPVAGGGAPVLVETGESPHAVVASAAGVYFIGGGTAPAVFAAAPDEGPATVLATPTTSIIHDLVIASDGTLYWTTDTQLQGMKA
jgi:hypothetical protein